jgi:flagellar hook-associated protein 2
MAIGGSLSGVNFSGLSSGIDTESIISRLMQLEAIPIQRLQQRQAVLTQRQGLLNQFKSKLTAFSSAAGALNSASSFNPLSATSSKTDVATITTSSGSVAGTYQLEVSKLAQSHKIASTAQASATTALGLSGNFTVNGKGVTIGVNDTLTTVAQKINAVSPGLAAGIIDGGANNAYLTLTSSTTGAASKIQIGDLSGGAAQALGLVSGAAALRETITGGATSIGFTSASTSLSSMLSFTGAGSKTFNLNGTDVIVDFDSTSLQGVANAINASASGVTASVRSVTVNGATQQKLDLTGLTTWTDADHALEALGVVQKGFGNQMVTAQDAEFKLDGVSLTSGTNSITTVIPGATLALLKANATTPETSTITLTRDNSAVKTKIKDFTDAYNSLLKYVKDNSKFDNKTFQTGALFGDTAVSQVETMISTAMFNTPAGLTGTFTNLTQIGFGLDSEGLLTVNDTTLDSAISNNIESLSTLFRSVGSSSNSQLAYLASTSKTKPSTSGGYPVVITQAATQHALLGEAAQASPLVQQEILTFSGALVGNSNYDLILDAGMTQAQIVDKINSDAKLKDLVTASVDAGQLKLTAKKFGIPGVFTVVSNRAAAPDTSGIGITTISNQGLDIAGTINGEAATGSGQLLTGAVGNANTEGLQMLYSGSATGAIGSLVFTKGVAPTFTDMVGMFTDVTNGLLTATDKSIQDQMDGLDKTIEEEAISRMQGQQTRLASMSN